MKRILLFVVTNFAIVITLSIILQFLGIRPGQGLEGLMIFAAVYGMGASFISLQISRWMAKRMTGMRLVDGRTGNQELDSLYMTIERLTRQANLPMPEVGVYDSPEVNAFATGPSKDRSLVAVSTGLLRSMRPDEVEGVLAHEVAHIANGDMVTMTLLQGVVNAFVIFFARLIASLMRGSNDNRSGYYGGNFMLVMLLEVVLGALGAIVTSWFSRQREFRADRGGASLAGRQKMIGALRRLMSNQQMVDPSHEALATLKINGMRRWMMFFSTHPPLEARIAALEEAR
jgi:heat shock protein HtpX